MSTKCPHCGIPHHLGRSIKCYEIELDTHKQQLAEARELLEDSLAALGEHPESEIDIPARIRQIRDEGRAHFHDVTRLLKDLKAAHKALRWVADNARSMITDHAVEEWRYTRTEIEQEARNALPK
jgi:hypothetical protein